MPQMTEEQLRSELAFLLQQEFFLELYNLSREQIEERLKKLLQENNIVLAQ